MRFLKPKTYSEYTSGRIRNTEREAVRITRRDFLKKLSAAGVVAGTANPLWESTKLISIPSGKIFTSDAFRIDKYGNITVNNTTDKVHTVLELHRWLMEMSDSVDNGDLLDITDPTPSERVTDNIIRLNEGYYVTNPEFLSEGSLEQKDEIWCGIKTIGEVKDTSKILINGKPALRPGHVLSNLQYLTATENHEKGNKWNG